MIKRNRKIGFFVFIRRLLGFGLMSFCFYIIFCGYKQWLKQSESFIIKKLEITGNELFPDTEILQLGGLDPKASIWKADLVYFENTLEENPFIEDVEIKRYFPSSIHITVHEKQPVALLNFKGRFHCLDKEGLVLPSKPGRLYDLPVISGQFEGSVSEGSYVSGNYVWSGLEFIQLVLKDRPRLYTEISEILVGKSNGLILYIRQDGIPVYLGYKELLKKIRCLEAIFSELLRSKMFSRVKYIDVRFQGQVVLGMRT